MVTEDRKRSPGPHTAIRRTTSREAIMFAGLHPTISIDLASSALAEQRRHDRARDQRAAGRRSVRGSRKR
jgi:hypothetical protein